MNNKIAIMQPYIFPYIGYLNLINASSKFIFYDDVKFIKKGWINRNRVMLNGEPYLFTIPLKSQSQNILINDTKLDNLPAFTNNFLKQLQSEYTHAPFKADVLDYVRDVLNKNHENISDLAIESVKLFFRFIGINKKFYYSSKDFGATRDLKKEDRLIKIIKLLNSREYLNSIGGVKIYSKDLFEEKGINLNFVKPLFLKYVHCNGTQNLFNPGLSIIDIMMNISENEINKHLNSYELV